MNSSCKNYENYEEHEDNFAQTSCDNFGIVTVVNVGIAAFILGIIVGVYFVMNIPH